mmetsp:Transcript_19262/g.49460  ORF Transcript_19262/g.49460 Transcript_19262/m.49460 type:complete len:259 (+) Transcript_19262:230-1006(+)
MLGPIPLALVLSCRPLPAFGRRARGATPQVRSLRRWRGGRAGSSVGAQGVLSLLELLRHQRRVRPQRTALCPRLLHPLLINPHNLHRPQLPRRARHRPRRPLPPAAPALPRPLPQPGVHLVVPRLLLLLARHGLRELVLQLVHAALFGADGVLQLARPLLHRGRLRLCRPHPRLRALRAPPRLLQLDLRPCLAAAPLFQRAVQLAGQLVHLPEQLALPAVRLADGAGQAVHRSRPVPQLRDHSQQHSAQALLAGGLGV